MKKCTRPSLKATLLVLSAIGLVLAALIAGGLATRDKEVLVTQQFWLEDFSSTRLLAIPDAIHKLEAALTVTIGKPVTVTAVIDAEGTPSRRLGETTTTYRAASRDLATFIPSSTSSVVIEFVYSYGLSYTASIPPTPTNGTILNNPPSPDLPTLNTKALGTVLSSSFGDGVMPYPRTSDVSGRVPGSGEGPQIKFAAMPSPSPPAVRPASAAARLTLVLSPLQDIEPGSASSDPGALFASSVHSLFFFAATTAGEGREPWVSDGTPQGTRMLKDLAPGTASSNPRTFTNCWDVVYFATDSGLYASRDGSSERLVNMGATSPLGLLNPGTFTCHNGRFVFTQADTSGGSEPWYFPPWPMTGAAPAARRVADVKPGPSGSNPSNFVSCGTALFFTADDGVHGEELWTWSGAQDAPPTLVADLNPGSSGAGFGSSLVCLANSVLFFAGNNGATGPEPWRYRLGIDAAPTPLEVVPGDAGSSPSSFVARGRDVFFVATAGGLTELFSIPAGLDSGASPSVFLRFGSSPGSGSPRALTVAGGRLFFLATTDAGLERPWSSAGTAVEPLLPAQLNPCSMSKFVPLPAGGVLMYGVSCANGTPQWWHYDPGTKTMYAVGTGVTIGGSLQFGRDVAILGGKVLVAGRSLATGREPLIADSVWV